MDTVWELVQAQACRTPAAVAIRGSSDLSYAGLIEQADALAGEIAERTPSGRVVAMELAQPSQAAAVILAAASHRCPVLPMNADSPAMHREFVLADARPALLVRGLADGSYQIDSLDADAGGRARPAGADGILDLSGAAYVIYTSGSTGRPKGVIIGHPALLDRLAAFTELPGFGPDDAIMSMTAPSFDISMAELLVPLTVGGCLIAAPAGTGADPAIFAAAVTEFRPTVIQATPSFWRLALAWGWPGSPDVRVWCGGEALTASLAEQLVPRCAELWNMYGPTEATIWVSTCLVRAGAPIELGRPLPRARMCLAGEDGQPITEPMRPGEILLYGTGLAEGYLNRPELTADRFLSCATPDGPQRCYRTGDLAQYRPDGTLHFLGRADGQIKLRGHRIELSEIEAVAEEQPGVLEAAAILRDVEDAERAHIALFVVTDGTLTVRQIRSWLAQRLPQYMRPARVLVERSLPRNTSGKLDRVSLAR
ncbi:MAG TPA: AMP-binding protein [Jatrophihabitans sp.]|nr:AMP-binding protein [Jatrophihabitans sp.]